MKRTSISVLLSLVITLFCSIGLLQADSLKLVINGQASYPDYQIIDNRTFLPLAFVSQQLGAQVDWNSTDQVVTFMKGSVVAQVQIGSNELLVNGNTTIMDVAPQIINNRTMLPISYVVNALGYSLNWDSGSNTITISNGNIQNNIISSDKTIITNDINSVSNIVEEFKPLIKGAPAYEFDKISKKADTLATKITNENVDDKYTNLKSDLINVLSDISAACACHNTVLNDPLSVKNIDNYTNSLSEYVNDVKKLNIEINQLKNKGYL